MCNTKDEKNDHEKKQYDLRVNPSQKRSSLYDVGEQNRNKINIIAYRTR